MNSEAPMLDERALARKLARALVLDINTKWINDTWIFSSQVSGGRTIEWWVTCQAPIFGNKDAPGLIDGPWRNRLPEWLTSETSLEELDLRLGVMGY